jgi:hypothetical protein
MPPAPKGVSTLWVAAGCVAVGLTAYALPLIVVTRTNTAPDPSKPLSAAAVRRGPYMNSGSRDVGIDSKK